MCLPPPKMTGTPVAFMRSHSLSRRPASLDIAFLKGGALALEESLRACAYPAPVCAVHDYPLRPSLSTRFRRFVVLDADPSKCVDRRQTDLLRLDLHWWLVRQSFRLARSNHKARDDSTEGPRARSVRRSRGSYMDRAPASSIHRSQFHLCALPPRAPRGRTRVPDSSYVLTDRQTPFSRHVG